MPLFKRPCLYSKMDKEDPEEVFHRRTRFLIHKVLQEADAISRRPPPSSFLRVKANIGKGLLKLRRSFVSAVRFGIHKHSLGGVNALKRLFRRGAGARSIEFPAPIFSLDV